MFFLLQSEKLEEAPMSIMLLYYTFPFVSFSPRAQLTFMASMALALRSVVKGAYVHFHPWHRPPRGARGDAAQPERTELVSAAGRAQSEAAAPGEKRGGEVEANGRKI